MRTKRQVAQKPLTPRGAATRARIVVAAAQLVGDRGVAGTSLDDIMAASQTSKSQLYHYFADKDALVLEVIALQAERVLAAQQPHLGALDSLRALRAWGQAIIRLKSTKRRNCRWTRRFASGRPLASPVTASVTVVDSMSPGLNFRQPAPTA